MAPNAKRDDPTRKMNTAGRPKKKDDEPDVPDSWTKGIPLSPSWWAPVFSALLILGLVWLVIYYFSSAMYPIPGIGHWNLVIGITIMMAGFIMTLRWR